MISEVDGSGTVRRDYVWVEHRGTSSATQAPGTALPLVQVTGLDTPGQEIAWIHTDHQNRQVILTNATGGLVRTVVTTPFGMLARDSGQTVHQTSAGFAGQWKLPEAGTNGIQYNWHRHYDPTLGRYTQPDPLGLIDGPSRYGYALQNPVRFDDPRGEFAVLLPALPGWAWGAGGAFAGTLLGTWLFDQPSEPTFCEWTGPLHNEDNVSTPSSDPDKWEKIRRPGSPPTYRPIGKKQPIMQGDRAGSGNRTHGGGEQWKRWEKERDFNAGKPRDGTYSGDGRRLRD